MVGVGFKPGHIGVAIANHVSVSVRYDGVGVRIMLSPNINIALFGLILARNRIQGNVKSYQVLQIMRGISEISMSFSMKLFGLTWSLPRCCVRKKHHVDNMLLACKPR